MKNKSCFHCKQCEFNDDKEGCKDALCYGYCPLNDDYEEGDIGSAIVAEMRRQNGDL